MTKQSRFLKNETKLGSSVLTCYLMDCVLNKPPGADYFLSLCPGIFAIIPVGPRVFSIVCPSVTSDISDMADWTLKALGGMMHFIVACRGFTEACGHNRRRVWNIIIACQCSFPETLVIQWWIFTAQSHLVKENFTYFSNLEFPCCSWYSSHFLSSCFTYIACCSL